MGERGTGFSCVQGSPTNAGWDGTLSYNWCDINDDEMLTKSTGKVTITQDGYYFLTFFADTVSIDGANIRCYLKQKSGSTETILGKLENWGDNDGNDDDYSSHAMSVIANLESGDEIYIDVSADHSSYLWSDGARCISFSGFRLK